MKRNILLNPGPACTSDAVKQAVLDIGDVCPREIEFGTLMKNVSEKIKTHLTSDTNEYEAVLFTTSGTGAMESIISSLPKETDRVLNIVNGEYGKRIGEMLEVYGIRSSTLDFGYDPINLDVIEKVLQSVEFSHICIVHCETTTGVINDIEKLAQIASKKNVKVIVDAMSSAFAYPINMKEWGIDFLACSSNKLVQGLAGIGIVVGSKKQIQRCHKRNLYLSLKDQADYFNKSNQMRFTPPVQILNALDVALDELSKEGLAKRYKRYEKLNLHTRKKMEECGFTPVIPLNESSIIITAYHEPAGFDFENFHSYMKERSFIVYPGKLTDGKSFRIANIGNITLDDVNEFLTLVKDYMKNTI